MRSSKLLNKFLVLYVLRRNTASILAVVAAVHVGQYNPKNIHFIL